MQLIEIFKAGKRLDANGIEVDITPADLAQAVAAYDVDFHEAPAVIGHPKHNLPAYAWVKSLHLEGDTLKAEFDQVDPEFAEMVGKGRFKKVSAAFYLANSPANPKKGSLYLRHVGFLGAMPPAVKGLRNPEFAENEEGVLQFNEEATSTVSNSLSPQQPTSEETMTPEEIAALKAENEALKAQQAQMEKEKAQAEQAKREAENADFAEGLIKAGKLAPVAKEKAINLLNMSATLSHGGVLEFNEGESLHSEMKAFLAAQPQIVAFHEVATKENAATAPDDSVQYAEGTSAEAIDMDKRVRAYMKEHNADYLTAFNAITQ